MADIGTFHSEKVTAGDAAVNGLFSGMLAGAVMAAYLVVALSISGESPADVLSRFGSADGATSPLVGAVSHLAMSAIYGIAFALIWRWIARRSNRKGLALVQKGSNKPMVKRQAPCPDKSNGKALPSCD